MKIKSNTNVHIYPRELINLLNEYTLGDRLIHSTVFISKFKEVIKKYGLRLDCDECKYKNEVCEKVNDLWRTIPGKFSNSGIYDGGCRICANFDTDYSYVDLFQLF